MTKFRVTGAVAAAALLLVGCSSQSPTAAAPSETPTPGTLASGSFTADLGSWGQAFDIEATGTGDDVSGAMEVSSPVGPWSVDLQCSGTTDDGLLVIGGEVTESTHEIAPEGVYAAILLAPGTPVRTLLWIEDESSPADSCPAFLETMFSAPDFVEPTGEHLVPIEGDLELAP